ncbi:MAG: alpha amylase C-terminal domain-containing protein, partial [Thermotogota bacterium]|nr:alpha amylase C-terminal domain-containing protein [Thermotogota bacterium]
YVDYQFEALPGKYRMVFDSDAERYGGHGRLLLDQYHEISIDVSGDRKPHLISLYLPTRTAFVLERI